MERTLKRIISLILSVCLMICVIPYIPSYSIEVSAATDVAQYLKKGQLMVRNQ